MIDVSRRRFLGHVGGGLAGSALAAGLPGRAARAAAPVTLIAGRRTLDVNGRAATVLGITQPDGTHGLSAEVGTPFQVTLRNELATDTLVHWHGLTPPYQQDGVPGISAPPVRSGGTAQYDFPLTTPGTYWMHSHEGLQEQALMSAPLIVHERGGSGDRQEIVLLLQDFSFRIPGEIFAALRHPSPQAGGMPGMAMRKGATMDLNDVTYDAFLANDRTLDDPAVVKVERQGRVLLRIINASSASNYRIDLGATLAKLVAVDGKPVHPVPGAVFPIAIAQRLDLEVDLAADQSVLPVFAVLEGERTRTGIVLQTPAGRIVKLGTTGATAAAPLTLALEQGLRASAPLPAKAADRVHQVDLTGQMNGYVWGLNGRTYGNDVPLRVARGQRVELVLTNRTMMSHPMHLHGHSFQVVAIDGRRFPGAVRDVVLVPPASSVTVAFDADNPGRWAFHCHNLYHMAAGMMTTVEYDRI